MHDIHVDGGTLYQWDTGRRLYIDPRPGETVDEVHYSYSKSPDALNVYPEIVDGVITADIPNVILQTSGAFIAYVVMTTEDGSRTTHSCGFSVVARPKPDDYVHTEEDVQRYETLVKRLDDIEANGVPDEQVKAQVDQYFEENLVEEDIAQEVNKALTEAKESGEFDGADGDDGYSPTVNLERVEGGVKITAVNETEEHSVVVLDGEKGEPGYTPQKGVDYFDGEPGASGEKGEDGFSPEIKLERTENGVKVTAINKDGEESQTVYDGKDGEDTEFFIVRIGSNNVSNHTEEEIQAAVGEGKICIAIGYTGDIYTYVGRMRKTDSESGYAATFYMPMKHAGTKADVNWIQISGNQAYHYLRNDARLANPWKLTLTGAVEAEYDGSKQTTVKIPTIAGPAGKDGYTPQKGIDYFDGKDGKDGTTGPAGSDGYSPTITLTRITGGVRIDAQNKSGTQTATVYDGKDGEGGEGSGGLPEGGEPHQMLVTDADGNTKWEERTHYEELLEGEILPENSPMFDPDAGSFAVSEPFVSTPEPGSTYTVVWNGTPYVCTAAMTNMNGLDCVFIGNNVAIGGEYTEEPFGIIVVPNDMVEVMGGITAAVTPLDGSTEVTLKITGSYSFVHKIDEKYLPLIGASNLVNGNQIGAVRSKYASEEIGEHAFAFGKSAKASANHSLAIGEGCEATGYGAVAIGSECKAIGVCSTAIGMGLTTSANLTGQVVLGRYNAESSDILVVGYGSTNAPGNVFTVAPNGNAWYAGNIYVGGTKQSEGSKVLTEADIDSIADAVIAKIPSAEGVGF